MLLIATLCSKTKIWSSDIDTPVFECSAFTDTWPTESVTGATQNEERIPGILEKILAAGTR
jgi:hypothetical protein